MELVSRVEAVKTENRSIFAKSKNPITLKVRKSPPLPLFNYDYLTIIIFGLMENEKKKKKI